MVWGVLFLLGSGGLLFAASNDHWRADWVLAGAPVFLIGLLILFLARRRRRTARTLYSLGVEVESQITQVTTVTRNGLVSCWVTTLLLKGPPGGELKFPLTVNPAAVPLTVLIHDGRVGVYGEHEGTREFRWKRL
jgi:hypothetical protein